MVIPFLIKKAAPSSCFAFLVLCGAAGGAVALAGESSPPAFLPGGAFLAFLLVQALWLHRAIQALRQDMHTPSGPKTPSSFPPASAAPVSGAQGPKDILSEARFLQQSLECLDAPHPPHIQGKSLQGDKTHLLNTQGLIRMLKDNRLEILVQPVVSLPQKRLRFFHCAPCVMVENGALIDLATLALPSRSDPSNQAIDGTVLLRALQFVRHHYLAHPRYRFICHLPATVCQDQAYMEEFCALLQKGLFPLQGLILELPPGISEPSLAPLLQLGQQGLRLAAKGRRLPENLRALDFPKVDFIRLAYGDIALWMKGRPRRQALEALQQLLEIPSQIIVSHVPQEQELYQNLPLPFDYASGAAFGLSKPFHQIQV